MGDASPGDARIDFGPRLRAIRERWWLSQNYDVGFLLSAVEKLTEGLLDAAAEHDWCDPEEGCPTCDPARWAREVGLLQLRGTDDGTRTDDETR